MSKRIPKNSGKPPSIQFYYKDWLEDQRLKRASKNAKGVWIDLIANSCDMPTPGVFADVKDHQTTTKRPQKDHRKTTKRPRSRQNMTSITPMSKREILSLLLGDRRQNCRGFDELVRRGILKTNAEGAFFVKRVYDDLRLRRIRKEAGKKGGNPNLVKQKPNQNPTPSTSTSTSTSKYSRNSQEFRLASLLFDEIKKRKPDYKKPNLQNWSVHIDRMIRLDGRKADRIEAVICWCQQDAPNGKNDFGWQNNILSTGKLREKFDKLELDMGASGGQTDTTIVEFAGPGPSPEFLQSQLDELLRIPQQSRSARDREDIARLQEACGK